MIDQLLHWSRLAGLTATVAEPGPPVRLQLQLEDIRPAMTVDVHGPTGPDDPYRLHSGFTLPPAAAQLPAERVHEIVEAAVLPRSALADARRRPDGSGVELIAVIYADGLSRHTFMTAIYECQKLRQIITRDVESAATSEAALSSLVALAESSQRLADTVGAGTEPAPAPPPAPAAAPAPAPAAPAPPPPEPVPTGPEPSPIQPVAGPPITPLPPRPRYPEPPSYADTPAPPEPSSSEVPSLPEPPVWEPPPLPDVPPPIPPDQQ